MGIQVDDQKVIMKICHFYWYWVHGFVHGISMRCIIVLSSAYTCTDTIFSRRCYGNGPIKVTCRKLCKCSNRHKRILPHLACPNVRFATLLAVMMKFICFNFPDTEKNLYKKGTSVWCHLKGKWKCSEEHLLLNL